MRMTLLLLTLLLASASGYGEGGSGIPWEEFKTLYKQSIERDVVERTAPPESKPQVYSIDEARYTLRVEGEHADGEALLTGRIVAGVPEAIPLFHSDVVITGVEKITGGSVLLVPDKEGVFFLPDEDATEFQLLVSLSMRPEEDAGSRAIALGIPQALRNSLDLTLPEGARLLESPGIAGTDGRYHFSPASSLVVMYLDKQTLATEAAPELDSVSRISVQKNRIFMTTHFLPARPLPGALILHAPEEAKFISSSLRASWIENMEQGRYALNLPPNHEGVFSIEFAALAETGEVSFVLPRIEGNAGQQGRFVIDEPDDGQVTITAQGMVSHIPVQRLGDVLGKSVAGHSTYRSVATAEEIHLAIERFQTAETPVTVLDGAYFFSAFEESGNILSVLVMDVPPEVGPRLKLKAIPNADIWSLTVNKVKREVYIGENGAWIIPLDGGKASHVALAFLQKGDKLGLQGRLEILVPETGLPCRAIRVGVALPDRVQLLSMDGPVNPAPGEGWELPTEFVGKQHFFSRSFYKGEGMKLAVFFKEPVKQAQNLKGVVR
jgi:hypothetical protein